MFNFHFLGDSLIYFVRVDGTLGKVYPGGGARMNPEARHHPSPFQAWRGNPQAPVGPVDCLGLALAWAPSPLMTILVWGQCWAQRRESRSGFRNSRTVSWTAGVAWPTRILLWTLWRDWKRQQSCWNYIHPLALLLLGSVTIFENPLHLSLIWHTTRMKIEGTECSNRILIDQIEYWWIK